MKSFLAPRSFSSLPDTPPTPATAPSYSPVYSSITNTKTRRNHSGTIQKPPYTSPSPYSLTRARHWLKRRASKARSSLSPSLSSPTSNFSHYGKLEDVNTTPLVPPSIHDSTSLASPPPSPKQKICRYLETQTFCDKPLLPSMNRTGYLRIVMREDVCCLHEVGRT